MFMAAWGSQTAMAADKWVKTDPSALNENDQVVIVDLTSGKAMSNNNGTSSAPSAVPVTLNANKTEISGTVDTNLTWFVELDNSGTAKTFKFVANLPASTAVSTSASYLYCINANNGVRVGKSDNTAFIMQVADQNNENDYLFNVAAGRYIGVFNDQDWRCYATVNNNIKETLVAFFKKTAAADDNRIETSMTFAEDVAELYADEGTTSPLPGVVVSYNDVTGAPMTISNPSITWVSSNESVATIANGANVINMIAPGTSTITAIYEGDDTYKDCSASFLLTVNSTAPALANIAALSSQTDAADYKVTLSDAVVTFVDGNYAYIQDASGAIVLYKANHGLNAGEILSGEATASFQVRNGNPQITNLTGYSVATGTAPEPTTIAAEAWKKPIASVLSQYFKVTGATITQSAADSKYYTQLGEENVQLYGVNNAKNFTLDNLEGTFTIVGFPTLYLSKGATNATPELQIFAVPEKEETVQPVELTAESDKFWKWTTLDDGDITETMVDDNIEITASSDKKVTIDSNGKNVGQEEFTKRLKFGGTGSETARCVHFKVVPNSTITVYGQSSSSSAQRTCNIAQSKFDNVVATLVTDGTGASQTYTYTGTEDADIYVYSANSGFNLYGIKVEPYTEEEEKHLYLIGVDVWNLSSIPEMTYNAETKAFEKEISYDSTIYFAISDVASAESWNEFGSHRYAIGSGNVIPTLGETVQLAVFGDGTIQLPPGTYKISVTEDMKMTVTGEIAVEDADYIVAGTPASVFGTEWNAADEDNRMTKQDDGTYAITYTAVAPHDNIEFKVVKNGTEWIGIDGNNVVFNVTSECDVTITFNPETNEITVTGDGVEFATELEYTSVYAVGEGEGGWLNGAFWDPGYEANKMEQVADDVWEITYSSFPLEGKLSFKFAIDGEWTHDFGGTFQDFNVETDAVYKGRNIEIPADQIHSQTITLRLDLTDFDFTTKTGAKFTIATLPSAKPVPDIATALEMAKTSTAGIRVKLTLKDAVVTYTGKVTDETLKRIEVWASKYFQDQGAKGMKVAPKHAEDSGKGLEFVIIEDKSGAMPFLGCGLTDVGIKDGDKLDGEIDVNVGTEFVTMAATLDNLLPDDEPTKTSIQYIAVANGSAEPTEITEDNAEEYNTHYEYRFVKFGDATLTAATTDEDVATMEIPVLNETVDVVDALGTGALLTEDGNVSAEGFMYNIQGYKIFQPTKMEIVTDGISTTIFFDTNGGAVYNLNGQRIAAPQKGVNIINGKKVVVK